jgi:hypothetical protein
MRCEGITLSGAGEIVLTLLEFAKLAFETI